MGTRVCGALQEISLGRASFAVRLLLFPAAGGKTLQEALKGPLPTPHPLALMAPAVGQACLRGRRIVGSQLLNGLEKL